MKILMKRTRIGWALGLGALNGCHGRARLLPVLALFLSVTGSAGAQQRNIRFTRLSVEKGPSQSVVNCIFHDRRGFMWFGSEDGLNGFDVYRF
ncbi:MAG: two-component regulator propeller domain-containing protein, partial [Acidobacteriota bacterium]